MIARIACRFELACDNLRKRDLGKIAGADLINDLDSAVRLRLGYTHERIALLLCFLIKHTSCLIHLSRDLRMLWQHLAYYTALLPRWHGWHRHLCHAWGPRR